MKKIIYFIIIFVSIFVLSNSINAWSKCEIGNKVTYNENDYYVIKNSDENNDTVTMLKAEPLSYEEVQTYSNGTGAQTYDNNGYGGMQYHSSSSVYSTSYVKTTVDAWKTAKAPMATEVRLITLDELTDNLGYEQGMINPSTQGYVPTSSTPSWVYNSNYDYWTMSQHNDSASDVWRVNRDGSLLNVHVNYNNVVRPVITISKSALGDTNEQEEINKDDTSIVTDNNSKKESKVAVNVPNTLEKISIIFIMIGIVLVSVSVVIVVRNRNIFNKKNGEK